MVSNTVEQRIKRIFGGLLLIIFATAIFYFLLTNTG